MVPDTGNGVWNCYRCQAITTIKGTCPDTGDGVRNCYRCQSCALKERTVANGFNAIKDSIAAAIGGWQPHKKGIVVDRCSYATATRKGANSDACNGVWNSHGCQARTIIKGMVPDTGDGI